MRPQIGQFRHVSLWFCGDEQKRKAETVLRAALLADEISAGIVLGPVEFDVVAADDLRLQGAKPIEDGAQVLAAFAEVLDFRAMPVEDAGFITNLAPADLERLRKATVKAYRKANPGGSRLTQDQIDRVLGRLGPEVARKLIHE